MEKKLEYYYRENHTSDLLINSVVIAGEEQIEWVNHTRLLGVTIDNTLLVKTSYQWKEEFY